MKQTNELKTSFLTTLESVLTIKAAATKHNIARQTIYRWMEEDKQFKKDVNNAIKNCILEVNDDCESKILKKIQEEDLQTIKFWLKYHHEDYKQSYIITK